MEWILWSCLSGVMWRTLRCWFSFELPAGGTAVAGVSCKTVWDGQLVGWLMSLSICHHCSHQPEGRGRVALLPSLSHHCNTPQTNNWSDKYLQDQQYPPSRQGYFGCGRKIYLINGWLPGENTFVSL